MMAAISGSPATSAKRRRTDSSGAAGVSPRGKPAAATVKQILLDLERN